MELLFPHRVEYEFSGPVTVDEVIGTLRANQVVTQHLGTFLQDLVPGLHVETIQLRVTAIALGSLKEIFTIALVATFQKELEREIPLLISSVTGADVSPEYNTIVTFAFVLLLYFGADFLQKVAIETIDTSVLRNQIDSLVSALSKSTDNTEPQIRRALEKFSRKSVTVALSKAALEFFQPSRSRNNEPIIVDELKIEPDIIKAVPKNVNLDALEDEQRSKELLGVQIEVRATDSDKDNQGWAGIVRTVSDKRMAMRLFPGIDREMLREHRFVTGDVIVLYKDKNGELKPSSFHLVRVHDARPD